MIRPSSIVNLLFAPSAPSPLLFSQSQVHVESGATDVSLSVPDKSGASALGHFVDVKVEESGAYKGIVGTETTDGETLR